MSDNLKTILELLPKLTIVELQTLENQLDELEGMKALRSLAQRKTDPLDAGKMPDGFAGIVVQEVDSMLRDKIVMSPGPAELAAVLSQKRLQDDASDLQKYIDRENRLSRNTQRSIVTLGCELLYRDMMRRHIPVTSTNTMRNLRRIPWVLEKEFPGYSKMGLLNLLVK